MDAVSEHQALRKLEPRGYRPRGRLDWSLEGRFGGTLRKLGERTTPPLAMTSRRFALALCAALFVGGVAANAYAGPEDFGPARSFMQTKHEALKKGVAKAGEPDAATVQIFDGMLDYDHFVRESLGSHWDTLDEGQRERFGQLLKKLIRGSYTRNLKGIAGYDVEYAGETQGDAGVLVSTIAKDPQKKRQEPLRIDYVVAKTAAGLRVRDIVTGGVSLVRNYRNQFGRLLKKDGFDALLGKMNAQLDKLNRSSDSQ